ncbi:sugar phosphate isomerase/epimerase family protein [Fodinicurvata sp. EGI_FJ10296]|uniref:sugar phosphate isomerase/epimerase family protein n=1 Tax=Fodinicurvata sp. EGI_FJ10296 TaxID=3231908 RepID=UPI0034560C2D
MMRISLCNEVLRDLSFEEQCEMAAALGYDGLEVAPFTLAEDPARLTAVERADVRSIAADNGLTITGLHWVLSAPANLSLTSDDGETLRRTRNHMLAMVDLCAELGGTVIVHGSPDQRRLEDASSPEAARATALDHFRAVGEAAGPMGVVYCIEPLSPKLTAFVNTVGEAAAIVDEIGLPGLKTMLDTSAAADSETAPHHEVIDRWLPSGHIAHIHFNDRDRRAPGQGDDRFLAIMRMLIARQYDGVIGIEPFRYEPSGVAAAAVARGYLRGLSEALEEYESQ